MKEKIYTIPINEAFAVFDGCPMCRLYAQLEKDSLSFVMGGAMMEPDVRLQTNRLGFCAKHLARMMAMNNRLSLALMLESHLSDVHRHTLAAASGGRDAQKAAGALREAADSCYVCSRVSHFFGMYEENTVYLWKTEPEFRDRFSRQSGFCLPHFAGLLACAQKQLGKKDFGQFAAQFSELEARQTRTVLENVSTFCKSFDHRFAGMELGKAKTAVEDACAFLTGKEV